MAAGEGRRLRPVTERWPKPVLPIDGRPVIATLVRELAATGFPGITIVTGRIGQSCAPADAASNILSPSPSAIAPIVKAFLITVGPH